MRRLSTILLAMTWLVAAMHILAGPAPPISAPATLKSITVTDPAVGKDLLLRIDGEYSFRTIQTSEGALYVDLQNVVAGSISRSAHWASGLIAGYQLLDLMDARGAPVLRVEFQTQGLELLIAERASSGLRLLFGQSLPASGSSTPAAEVVGSSPNRTTGGPALVSDVLIKPGTAGEVTIDVATTQSPVFRVFQLRAPARLVVDMEGVRNAVPRKSFPVSSPVVTEVRVGQFRESNPEVARVVADLSGDPVFDVHAYTGGVRIEVKPRSMATSRGVAGAQGPGPETAAKRYEPKPVQQTWGPASRVPSTLSHSAVSTVPEPRTEVIPSRTYAAVPPLPNASGAPTPARANATPKPRYNGALSAGDGSREVGADLRLTPTGVTPETLRAENAAQVLDGRTTSNLAEAPGATPAGSAPPREERPLYTGEPISLNLKDVDLKDFFRLIHELSGLNVLVDSNVTGSITTVLDNVPWDQALDIVLRDNGLGRVVEGNVLHIAKLDTLAAEQETMNKLAAARMDAAPMVTIFRPVNYAKASTLATLLAGRGAGGKGGIEALSGRGSVLVDERNNTLIIRDITSQIPIIQSILDKLDTKTKQVAIEARIVLATSSLQRTLSAALVGTASNVSGSTIGAAQTGATSGAGLTPTTTTPPTFTIPQNPISGFGTVAVTNFASRYLIDAAISAAEIRSEAKTISRPSIITQNNVQGMVQQGTQIPVQTSINNTISVQYIDATLQLRVTPQVTDDGHIFLIINVQNRSPGSITTNVGISINTQEATTQVLVPDGGTVVFGGVNVTQRSNSSNGIPVLGNIPILGHLFKSTTVQDSDQELLFFVSPRILPG